MDFKYSQRKIKAFTLIEIMMVIVLIGLMASVMQFNMGINKPDEMLKQSSARFAGVFNIAAEYSLLNNIELGLVIEKTGYQFVAYDGTRWSEIGDNDLLVPRTLVKGIEIELQLDDLPIAEEDLVASIVFVKEDDDFYENDIDEDEYEAGKADQEDQDGKEGKNGQQRKKRKKFVPKVYILSGGDMTPFSLTFRFVDDFNQDIDDDEQRLGYRVTGLYSTPLTITGPTLDEE